MLAFLRYCSGENICSSCWPSWNSPTPPRDLTLERTFLRSPTPVGELLHLAEAFLNLAEVGGDLAEGLGEAGLQGGVELFVDRDAHLFELGGVGGVELFQSLFDGEAELVLLVVGFAGEFSEAVVQSLASLDLIAVDLADEVREALRDGVEVLLDGSAEGLVGGLVIAAKGVETVLQKTAEFGDGGGDLGAESGEVVCACLAGAPGFVGAFGAEFCDFAAQVAVKRFIARVKAGELVGKLGETRVQRAGPAACGAEGG